MMAMFPNIGGAMLFRVRFYLILLLAVACLLAGGCADRRISPRAAKGALDLSGWDFHKDGIVSLNGEWEFYWQKLLDPADFKGAAPPGRTGFFNIPGYWNGHEVNGKSLKGDGYATFRLKVKIKPGQERLAIRLEDQGTAYRLWINGKLLMWNGVVGKNREEMTPQYLVRIAEIGGGIEALDVILQVSNFNRKLGGPYRPVSLSNEYQIRNRQTLLWTFDLVLFGILFIIGLYHVVFYVLRSKDPTPLYFGCICLLWALHIPFWGTGGKFITVLFPRFPWEIAHKMDLLTWYPIVPLMLMFISALYPKESSVKIVRLSQVVAAPFLLVTILTPARISSHTILPYELFALMGILPVCWSLFRAVAGKREGARLIIFGTVVFFITGINEILYDIGIIHTFNLIPAGLLAMILSQSLVLSRRYARAFSASEALSEEMEQKNIALARLDRLKDEFLARTSHELRTPLTGIIGIAESLMDGIEGRLSRNAASNLSMIVSSGRRLANLINDILDFSRLKNRDIHLNKRPVDIRTLTDTVLTVSRRLAAGKPVELENRIPEDISPVLGDEDRLHQILYNLIGNAVKFTERGEIRVSAVQKDSTVEITVSDTGVGIPKNRLEDIFKSFEQVDSSDARAFGGTGLGLSITKHLVELHGGRITAESGMNRGATFRFTLPVSHEEPVAAGTPQTSRVLDAAVMPPADNLPDHPAGSDGDPRVLVVDDDPVNLRVAANYLSFQNIRVSTSTSGQDALDRIESGGRPDLIVLDVMMPGMSGYEVCRKLRARFSPSELPIVMLTAKNMVTDLVQGFESGANDYLVKPFSKDELLSRVWSHLKLKEAYETLEENLKLKRELARREQTEQELKLMQRRMSGMLDTVDEALMAVNENEEISFCNSACNALLGYRPQELLGSPLMKVFPEDAGESLKPLMADISGDAAFSDPAKIYTGLTLRDADGTPVIRDILRTTMEMEDEILSILILRQETSPPGERLPVPAMALIEEMNRNRDRLQSLEEALNGLTPKVLEGHPGFLQNLRAIDTALDQVSRSLSDDRDMEDRRRMIVETATLCLDYWAEATGTTKIELAESSGLWKVYTNLDGWERTQTLDRYLDIQTLPRKPRQRQVIQTAEFVLAACDTESDLRDRLEAALTRLRILG